MLAHSIFRGRSGDLDYLHIFTIGLLYCKGTTNQKMDALLATYDTNDDGILFTTSMKKINTDLVTTAAVIMPALVHKVQLDEADAQANEEVDNQVNEANSLIFGN